MIRVSINDDEIDEVFAFFFKLYDATLCGGGPDIKIATLARWLDEIRKAELDGKQ